MRTPSHHQCCRRWANWNVPSGRRMRSVRQPVLARIVSVCGRGGCDSRSSSPPLTPPCPDPQTASTICRQTSRNEGRRGVLNAHRDGNMNLSMTSICAPRVVRMHLRAHSTFGIWPRRTQSAACPGGRIRRRSLLVLAAHHGGGVGPVYGRATRRHTPSYRSMHMRRAASVPWGWVSIETSRPCACDCARHRGSLPCHGVRPAWKGGRVDCWTAGRLERWNAHERMPEAYAGLFICHSRRKGGRATTGCRPFRKHMNMNMKNENEEAG